MAGALYARRAPEKTTLHEIVRENLETFITQTEAPDSGRKPLPKYVTMLWSQSKLSGWKAD